MWDFPRFALEVGGADAEVSLQQHVHALTGVTIQSARPFATLKYGVTRFRITLACYHATCRRRGPQRDDVRWVTLADVEHYPLSVTGRKISRLLADLPSSGL